MPYVFKDPKRPKPWRQYRWRVRNPFAVPFLYVEWASEWAAWFLGRWVFLEVLEYCGTLSLLIGVIFYFADAHNRKEQKHYQAWQVINTAEGKGGNGGRIDALQDLNEDGIPLVGVGLSGGAFLRNINLHDADLTRANMAAADIRNANLRGTNLEDATLVSANFRGANINNAQLDNADLTSADLTGASLIGTDLSQAILDQTDLRNADLSGIANWKAIKSIKLANIQDCKNAPDGFKEWALAAGAVEIASDAEWNRRIAIAATQPAR